MAMFKDQLRQVLRRLSRAPLFTAITLLTLAIGIGANTVIFSVVEGVLLKPLPYRHPGAIDRSMAHGARDRDQGTEHVASVYFIDREQRQRCRILALITVIH